MNREHENGSELANSHHRDSIVVEYSRNVFGRKFVGSVADEQACFSYCTVSNDYTPVRF